MVNLSPSTIRAIKNSQGLADKYTMNKTLSTPESLPEVLQSSFELFVGELEKHLVYFDDILAQIQMLKQNATEIENVGEERAKTVGERFHLIRGGASFLGLEDITIAARAGENLLQESLDKRPEEVSKELLEIINSLKNSYESLTS